jgi:hypothetical protein
LVREGFDEAAEIPATFREPLCQSELLWSPPARWLLARFIKQAPNSTLGIVRQFLQPVDGNVLLNRAVGPALTRLDLDAQQSCEK